MTAIFTSQIIYSRIKKTLIFQANEQAPLLCFLGDYWFSHRPNCFTITLGTHIIISICNSQVIFDLGHLLTLNLDSATLEELISQLIETFLHFSDQKYQISFFNAPRNFSFPNHEYVSSVTQNSS